MAEKKSRTLVEVPNSWSSSNVTVGRLRKLAHTILNGLEEFSDDEYKLPETSLATLAEIEQIARNPGTLCPLVECWCVVKFYADKTFAGGSAISCGFTTASQARAFAKMMQVHYDKQWKPWWGKETDKYRAQRAFCSVLNIINPKLTATEYAKWLAT